MTTRKHDITRDPGNVSEPERHSGPSVPERRHAILDGFRISCMIHAALSAGIFDQLAAQPLDPRSLAFNNSLDPEAVASMCRWLAHEEVLEEIAPDVFGLGPVGLTHPISRTFRSCAPSFSSISLT